MNMDALSEQMILLFVLILIAYLASKVKLLPANANKVLEDMLKEQLTAAECALFDETVGLVEASIGRMVPVQTERSSR